MKNVIIKSILALSVVSTVNPALANEIGTEEIGNFLCQVQMCKNEAVISKIKVGKYNLANLSEKLAGNGKQVLTISFHQETPDGEFVRDYTGCTLTVSSATAMTLSSCKITGTVKAGPSSRVHALSLGANEIMHSQEAGWMATNLSNE